MLQSIYIIKCYFFDEVLIIINFQHLGMYSVYMYGKVVMKVIFERKEKKLI